MVDLALSDECNVIANSLEEFITALEQTRALAFDARAVVATPTLDWRKAGKLKFSLHGQAYTLTAFVSAEDTARRRLFVPFRDLTAGLETYAAGRYLDLDRTPTGLYDLDFNLAYQPYCYYDAKYDCPIPPAENRLSVPIRAGERIRPQ